MTNQLIPDAKVQAALDWLEQNSSAMGSAKAEAVKAEHMLRHVKALAMSLHLNLPVSAQEREAYASPQYLEAIDKAAQAIGHYETMKSRREAAALTIEAWRTASSNMRATKL